ncbi:MAG TPA: peptidyl-prolyl cis-trans isomerase [Kofleriaceae bacterium]
MSWKTIVREPLLHFVAIGAVLFAIDAWRSSDAPAQPPAPPAPATEAAPPVARGPIVVDADRRKRSAAQAEQQLGRPPTPAEIDAELERWIDEEVLFREAVARGLERDDPVIHQRIAARMSYVLEQAIIIPEPGDAELRPYFDKHRERWAVPSRIDFTHIFVADPADGARLDGFARAIASGAPPDGLGDPFPGGRRYRGRKVADLAASFGDEFVAGLAAQPAGTWQRRTSRHGLHLVRVDKVETARDADFAAARLDVRKAWLDERRASELAAAIRRLRGGWEVEKR